MDGARAEPAYLRCLYTRKCADREFAFAALWGTSTAGNASAACAARIVPHPSIKPNKICLFMSPYLQRPRLRVDIVTHFSDRSHTFLSGNCLGTRQVTPLIE